MKQKPNIDAFLDAGSAAESPKKPIIVQKKPQMSPNVPPIDEFRKQMVMQLPVTLINDLKRRALELSVSSGRRVTQQQLVEQALREFLNI